MIFHFCRLIHGSESTDGLLGPGSQRAVEPGDYYYILEHKLAIDALVHNLSYSSHKEKFKIHSLPVIEPGAATCEVMTLPRDYSGQHKHKS